MNRVNSNHKEIYDVSKAIDDICVEQDYPELPEYEEGFDDEAYKSELIQISHATIESHWEELRDVLDLPTLEGLVEHFIGENPDIPKCDFHSACSYGFYHVADMNGYSYKTIAAYLD